MIRIDRKLNSIDVADALTDVFILRGPPEFIRSYKPTDAMEYQRRCGMVPLFFGLHHSACSRCTRPAPCVCSSRRVKTSGQRPAQCLRLVILNMKSLLEKNVRAAPLAPESPRVLPPLPSAC